MQRPQNKHLLLVGYLAITGRISAFNDDRGEGVISTAIAVLVVAFLGAAMWVGFDAIWGSAESNIGSQIDQIGR